MGYVCDCASNDAVHQRVINNLVALAETKQCAVTEFEVAILTFITYLIIKGADHDTFNTMVHETISGFQEDTDAISKIMEAAANALHN